MRLLYFDPESNNHEGLEEASSSRSVALGEVALVTSGEAIDVLTNSISEAFEAGPNEEFFQYVGISPDQARYLQKRLAQISDVTYLPR